MQKVDFQRAQGAQQVKALAGIEQTTSYASGYDSITHKLEIVCKLK